MPPPIGVLFPALVATVAFHTASATETCDCRAPHRRKIAFDENLVLAQTAATEQSESAAPGPGLGGRIRIGAPGVGFRRPDPGGT
jgi:hypothetical protein